MSVSPRLRTVLDSLSEAGWQEVEVYRKRGRSRRLEYGADGRSAVFSEETGWAVRAGDRRRSFFVARSGEPDPEGPWPEPLGAALHLPEAHPIPVWKPPADLDSPLIGEQEAYSLLEGLSQALHKELPGACLLRGTLDDGSSEVELASNRGVQVRYRNRAAALRLEAVLTTGGDRSTSLSLAAREGRSFSPLALARRLADRLVIAQRGEAPERDRGEILLAPEVAAQILAGLVPLFVGAESWDALKALEDRGGRIGSGALTLVDDGRFPRGALEAPVDGEGVATRSLTLVEEGCLRQPLLPWWQAETPPARVVGCRRRAGWRNLPRTGPTHFYVQPRPETAVASLLEGVSRGYYFIGATAPGHFDLAAARFSVPICGFAVRGGRPTGPVSGACLCGGIGALLRGVQGVARDLHFFPLDGMIGSPTLLVTGLEVRHAP